MKASSNKMNFFAKRPKTPVEVVRGVRDLVAPGGRLGADYTGSYEGKKKVRDCSSRSGVVCWLGEMASG